MSLKGKVGLKLPSLVFVYHLGHEVTRHDVLPYHRPKTNGSMSYELQLPRLRTQINLLFIHLFIIYFW